jgi:hypothetical protein
MPAAAILVADDVPANLGLLSDSLSHAGYRVLVAESDEGALARKVRNFVIELAPNGGRRDGLLSQEPRFSPVASRGGVPREYGSADEAQFRRRRVRC